ncbi:hypothetical protein SGPA1_22068 [Streptomyces misionensis JCM 4497]
MDVSSAGLRVLRQITESGSFTAAAARLGYTQSAVSRQAASLEHSAGAALFERRSVGVRLTPAGQALLRHAHTILDAVAAAEHDLAGTVARTEHVRLGVFLSAGAVALPAVLARLAQTDPQITVTTRDDTTPTLIRALRAGSIDLAVLTSRPSHRPLDSESPRLHLDIVEDTELMVAVPSAGQFACRTAVHIDELVGTAGDRHTVVAVRAAARRPARPAGTAAHRPLRPQLADETPAGRVRLRGDDGAGPARPGAAPRSEPAAHGSRPASHPGMDRSPTRRPATPVGDACIVTRLRRAFSVLWSGGAGFAGRWRGRPGSGPRPRPATGDAAAARRSAGRWCWWRSR